MEKAYEIKGYPQIAKGAQRKDLHPRSGMKPHY